MKNFSWACHVFVPCTLSANSLLYDRTVCNPYQPARLPPHWFSLRYLRWTPITPPLNAWCHTWESSTKLHHILETTSNRVISPIENLQQGHLHPWQILTGSAPSLTNFNRVISLIDNFQLGHLPPWKPPTESSPCLLTSNRVISLLANLQQSHLPTC